MEWVRHVTNAIMRDGLAILETASPTVKRHAIDSIVKVLSPFQFALLQRSDNRALVDAVRIVAQAIVSTPYGRPLRYPAPLLITLGLSRFCPYSCSNCYSSSGQTRRHDAPEMHLALVERIAASPTPCVMISGGEPLALPNIREVLGLLIKAGKFVYLATNSSITPITDLISEHGAALFPLLSVWGTMEEHDRQRGAGSFERIERNLESLNERGYPGRLLIVLTSGDLAIFDSVDSLVAKHRVASVLITRKLEVGRSDGSRFELRPAIVGSIMDRTRSIRRYVRQVYLDVPELRTGNAGRPSWLRKTLGIPAHNDCSAGNWMMHLDFEGAAYPCYTFEGSAEKGAPAHLTIAQQWAQIRRDCENAAGSPLCLGEALSHERI
jgi:MoaA/NifB/PqqE/SkfB family radical SAM enzyme